jgi:hypothetical protein
MMNRGSDACTLRDRRHLGRSRSVCHCSAMRSTTAQLPPRCHGCNGQAVMLSLHVVLGGLLRVRGCQLLLAAPSGTATRARLARSAECKWNRGTSAQRPRQPCSCPARRGVPRASTVVSRTSCNVSRMFIMPGPILRTPTHVPLNFPRLSPTRFAVHDTSLSSSNRTPFERRTAEMSSAEARPAARGIETHRHVVKHRPLEASAARAKAETDVRGFQSAARGCRLDRLCLFYYVSCQTGPGVCGGGVCPPRALASFGLWSVT